MWFTCFIWSPQPPGEERSWLQISQWTSQPSRGSNMGFHPFLVHLAFTFPPYFPWWFGRSYVLLLSRTRASISPHQRLLKRQIPQAVPHIAKLSVHDVEGILCHCHWMEMSTNSSLQITDRIINACFIQRGLTAQSYVELLQPKPIKMTGFRPGWVCLGLYSEAHNSLSLEYLFCFFYSAHLDMYLCLAQCGLWL